MRRSGGHHAISGAFVFLLLGVFAVVSTLLVLLCAQAYRNTVDQTALHRDERIIQSFLRNTLRAEDAQGVFDTVELDGMKVLTITSDDDGDRYIRYLYCYEGMFRDLLLAASDAFDPALGEEICPAQSFSATIQEGFARVEMTDGQGKPYTFLIAHRCAW